MKPGDVATCTCCGAQAVAQWTPQDRPWQEGWPLTFAWTHGPEPRVTVTAGAADRCPWCFERQAVLGKDAAPLYRPAPGAAPGTLEQAGLNSQPDRAPARLTGPAGFNRPAEISQPTQRSLF